MENQDSTNSFQVNLDQFNGPLDLLLDLAKSQKVNLENISITLLADQFLDHLLIRSFQAQYFPSDLQVTCIQRIVAFRIDLSQKGQYVF